MKAIKEVKKLASSGSSSSSSSSSIPIQPPPPPPSGEGTFSFTSSPPLTYPFTISSTDSVHSDIHAVTLSFSGLTFASSSCEWRLTSTSLFSLVYSPLTKSASPVTLDFDLSDIEAVSTSKGGCRMEISFSKGISLSDYTIKPVLSIEIGSQSSGASPFHSSVLFTKAPASSSASSSSPANIFLHTATLFSGSLTHSCPDPEFPSHIYINSYQVRVSLERASLALVLVGHAGSCVLQARLS